MEIANGRINIFIGEESTTIELFDNDAATLFAKVTLTPQQLSAALSRVARTDCKIEVLGLDRVGKKMEWKKHEFKLPERMPEEPKARNEILKVMANQTCPEGWIAEPSFTSQDSFFEQGKTKYARCTIRRWI